MTDIALLVTEQFEKEAKRGAPVAAGGDSGSGGDGDGERRNFGAVSKAWSSWVEAASAVASGVRASVAVQLRELEEPKTALALAAAEGLFSA